MTYNDFQRELGKAGLSVGKFAEVLGMNRNSVSNYAKQGQIPTHLAVIAALLGEMAEAKIDFNRALKRVEITPKKPRGAGNIKRKWDNK